MDQATQKQTVRRELERLWKSGEAYVRLHDHELIVIAVPTYPADIEAVSAVDLGDIAELLAAFAKHREEKPNEYELVEIEPAPAAPQGQARQTFAFEQDRDRAIKWPERHLAFRDDTEPLGQGHNGGGAPQECAEPSAEPYEGDARADAMERLITGRIRRET